MAELTKYVSNQLFDHADRSLIAPMIEHCREFTVEQEEVIFREGDSGHELYLIGRGAIQITKQGRGGRPELLQTLQTGEFFGEMALLDDEPRSATANAAVASELLVIPRATFNELLTAAPTAIARNLIRNVNARLRASNNHFIKEMLRAERLSFLGSVVSGIIHDLKNPLTCARLACEMLGANAAPETTKLARMSIEGLDEAFDMIQEILDFSRGEHRCGTESCTPGELIDDVVKQITPLADQYDVVLSVKIEATHPLSLDRRRIVRCFLNITRNAIEAMPEGGHLEILSHAKECNEVCFEFLDTGVGIRAEDLPHVFEPFFTSGKSGGTGLGLALCKAVVTAHGGRITVESKEGAGTKFTVRLPCETRVSPLKDSCGELTVTAQD